MVPDAEHPAFSLILVCSTYPPVMGGSEIEAQRVCSALIERGHGYVTCPGGTGTLVELAIVWEMLNKAVMPDKPFAVLGHFWQPILDRVREVEQGPGAGGWGEANGRLVHTVSSAEEAAEYLAERLGIVKKPKGGSVKA